MESLEPSASWIWCFFRTPMTATVVLAHWVLEQGSLAWPALPQCCKYFLTILGIVCQLVDAFHL